MVPGKYRKSLLAVCLGVGVLCLPVCSIAQVVDCSGMTPDAFTSINAALLSSGNNSWIFVVPGTTCSEDVPINGMSNVNIGTDWGQRVSLKGSFNINGSQNVYLYGFDVTSPNADGNHAVGILVTNSTNVIMDACTSRYNQGSGLRVDGHSSAYVQDWGDYSHNGDRGVSVTSHSYMQIVAWGGEIDIMFNKGAGLYVDRSALYNLGRVFINDNLSTGAVQPDGFGVDIRGMATAAMFGLFGPAEMSGNQGGGISLMENSQLSLGGNQSWAPYPILIATNYSTGISEGFGSQLTMFGGVQIVEHATVGVDLYGKSQAAIYGDNLITHIGSGMEPGKAAIRVDGNSEAYLRNGSITQNTAPGIIAMVNSSVDAMGVSFSSNAGPNFVCDGSAYITGDVTPSSLGAANTCRVPGIPGAPHRFHPPTGPPDWHTQKAAADRFKAFSSKFRH
jgi:hypothetical protein